jgi:hypothetical protein
MEMYGTRLRVACYATPASARRAVSQATPRLLTASRPSSTFPGFESPDLIDLGLVLAPQLNTVEGLHRSRRSSARGAMQTRPRAEARCACGCAPPGPRSSYRGVNRIAGMTAAMNMLGLGPHVTQDAR